MNCRTCEDAQGQDKNDVFIHIPEQFAYIRVGAASVLVSGCDRHIGELFRIYKKGLEGLKNEQNYKNIA